MDSSLLTWEVVGAGLFHYKKQGFIVIIDYYSRYPEVLTLSNTSSKATIEAVKSVFAHHGISVTVRTDNNSQFLSGVFPTFSKDYGFKHKTSSPRFPVKRCSGESSSHHQISDRQGRRPLVGAASYGNTLGVCGYSPAQLLFGRKLRTRLPRS